MDASGAQHTIILGDLDIAGGDDRIGGLVVDQLVGGYQEIAGHQVAEMGRGVGLLRTRLRREEGQEARENERREGLSSCRRYPSSRWNRPATPSNVKMPAGVHAASTGGSLPERPRASTRSEMK